MALPPCWGFFPHRRNLSSIRATGNTVCLTAGSYIHTHTQLHPRLYHTPAAETLLGVGGEEGREGRRGGWEGGRGGVRGGSGGLVPVESRYVVLVRVCEWVGRKVPLSPPEATCCARGPGPTRWTEPPSLPSPPLPFPPLPFPSLPFPSSLLTKPSTIRPARAS